MKTKMREFKGMQIIFNAIQLNTNVPECITFNKLNEAKSQGPTPPATHGIHHTRVARQKRQITMDITTYWTFGNDMAFTGEIFIKGQCIVIPEA